MSTFVLWSIGVLAALLWALAIGFIVFSWVMLNRQLEVFRHILARLERLDDALLGRRANMPKQKTALSIPKDEPIKKYASVSLPDDVEISFVEKDK